MGEPQFFFSVRVKTFALAKALSPMLVAIRHQREIMLRAKIIAG
jgi:hypothetical protein